MHLSLLYKKEVWMKKKKLFFFQPFSSDKLISLEVESKHTADLGHFLKQSVETAVTNCYIRRGNNDDVI